MRTSRPRCVRLYQALRRLNPGLSEHTANGAGPARGTEPRSHRTLLSRGRAREHEHRARSRHEHIIPRNGAGKVATTTRRIVRPCLATVRRSGTICLVRILQIAGQSHRRGAEMFALELASGLDAMGHDNRMVALGLAFDGGRDPDLPALTTHTAIGPRAIVASALHLRRLLAREPFDVVLAHGGSAAQAASLVPRSRRPLLIWQRILGFPPAIWKPAQRRWWQVIMRRIDVVVVMTHDIEIGRASCRERG